MNKMGRGRRGGQEEATRSMNDAVVQNTSLWLETSYSWRGDGFKLHWRIQVGDQEKLLS